MQGTHGKRHGAAEKPNGKKVSIRFFKDREVRAVWDDTAAKWWFCAVDVVAVLSESVNPSNYWYVLKNRLKKSCPELLTKCKGFKIAANDDRETFMKGIDYSYYYEQED